MTDALTDGERARDELTSQTADNEKELRATVTQLRDQLLVRVGEWMAAGQVLGYRVTLRSCSLRNTANLCNILTKTIVSTFEPEKIIICK